MIDMVFQFSLDAGAHEALNELALEEQESYQERGDGGPHVQDFSQLF